MARSPSGSLLEPLVSFRCGFSGRYFLSPLALLGLGSGRTLCSLSALQVLVVPSCPHSHWHCPVLGLVHRMHSHVC